MNIVLFDGPERLNLLPFTFTHPVSELRVGILTLREKWELVLNKKASIDTEEYLSNKWPLVLKDDNIFINSAFIPSQSLVERIFELGENQKLTCKHKLVAYKFKGGKLPQLTELEKIEIAEDLLQISHPWDMFTKNHEMISRDFDLLTKDRKSAKIHESVFTINSDEIFIEEDAQLKNVSLNAENGPIYIAKNAEVMEGCHIRGPFSLGEHSTMKLGAKVYGPTTIGKYCKVGGEVKNSIIGDYSNKSHDGYLGNSVIGDWCNLGADTNNSNLKNNYAIVKLWNYEAEELQPMGLQFCGLIMGDHSKTGINTMFNTGTVVGVNANIFGSGFPQKFVPSFTWGMGKEVAAYKRERAFETAERVMALLNKTFTEEDRLILNHVYKITQKYRSELNIR